LVVHRGRVDIKRQVSRGAVLRDVLVSD
jgi:hypothetical protein